MGRVQLKGSKAWTLLSGSACLPAWAALVIILLAAYIATGMNDILHQERMRADLLHKTNLVASRLQGLVNANVDLARGMTAVLRTEPQIDQERFSEFASNLLDSEHQLETLGAAPDLVVSLIHPIKGNEAAIGLDYRKHPVQRASAIEVRKNGKMALAGPVELVQGGQAFLAHFPVYVESPDQPLYFWGLLTGVIDSQKLYEAAGLFDDPSIHFAIKGRDTGGPDGALFFGKEDVLAGDPVSVELHVASGSWQISAIPANGWNEGAPNNWMIWIAASLAFLLMGVPYAAVGWLNKVRVQQHSAWLIEQRKSANLSRRLELALESSRIGVWEFDLATGIPNWDDRMNELYGFEVGHQANDAEWRERLHPEDLDRVVAQLDRTLEMGESFESQFRIVWPNGQVRSIRALGSLHLVGDKRSIVGFNWDVTEEVERTRQLDEARLVNERRLQELEEANARIRDNSLHDFLTGLPNRRYLDDRLKGVYGPLYTVGTGLSLLKIDLDGFKKINDSLGHAAGDAMLVHVANVLKQNMGKGEFAARIGGDEFVVLSLTEGNSRRPRYLAERILRAMQKPVDYQGTPCHIGVSIGIAHGSSAKGDADKLLSNADLALYHSKQNGKGCYTAFSQSLYKAARRQQEMADDILRGLENGEFVPFYQGQYRADDHTLCGAESLARWMHPEKGLLMPADFIEVAENLNVVGAIDAAVLEQAVADKRKWADAGLDLARISVNVSARRLGDKNLIPSLKQLNLDTRGLTFELVETTFLDRSDELVAWNIDQIREMGIDIELDDFGTAYASIVSLTHLRPTRLKIDRQLVSPTDQSEEARKLLRSILDIAHTMGIGSVAEGVETMHHARIMRDMGAEILQGYAFCKPIPADQFLAQHLAKARNVA